MNLYQAIIDLIGQYSPILDINGMPILGISGIDYTYLAMLFILYSFFKAFFNTLKTIITKLY